MGKVRQVMKQTPLRQMYYWVRRLPPVKKVRGFAGRKIKDYQLFHRLPAIYRQHLSEPLDEKKIVIVEHRLASLEDSYSFQYLHKVLKEEYNFDVHIHFLRQSYVPRRQYYANCAALFHDMATAKYVFLGDSMDIMGCFERREGQKIVQLWHACGAFKRFGMSTADYIFGGSAEAQLRHPPHVNYTCATVSSEEVRWAYAEAFNLKDHMEVIRPLGVSRTDIFYQPDTVPCAYEKVYEAFPQAKGKKIILFAPTFRGRVAFAKTALEFDPTKFYEAFRDEYVLILKHHPLVREIPEIPDALKDFAYDATRTLKIEDLLCVSDICISDYSSLIYEYSLFTRPMLFFAYDKADYDDWRGFYYPYEELTPGPVFTTNEEMVDYIRHVDERFDPQTVIDFKQRFMGACDGHATQRILEDTMGRDVLKKYHKD